MQRWSLLNGNGHHYSIDIPVVHITDRYINDAALEHILDYTGLDFKDTGWGYVAQPVSCHQIVKLIIRYNYTSNYHDNATHKNILFLTAAKEEV